MIPRAVIVQEARTWLGTPYRHQGRVKGVGVDCLGLLIGLCRNLGVVAPDFDIADYSRQPDGTLLARADQHLTRIDLAGMQIGDAVAMVFEREPCHFGILADYRIAGHLSLIHALCRRGGRGLVVEHRLDATNLIKVVAAYRLPGVA